jgi:hypothetical protein
MGGSRAGENEAELALKSAATSTADHSAGKRGVGEQGGQPLGGTRGGEPATSKESKKVAARREETSNGGTPRKEDKSNTGLGAEGVGTRDGQGPRGWCPWWPSGRKEEESPGPPQGPRTEI